MPPRLTARDQGITAWIARWQPVTAYQVAERFQVKYQVASRRLKTIRNLGYIDSHRPVKELPGVYYVTRNGFSLIGVRGSSMRTNPFTVWGQLATVDDVIGTELAGATVLSAIEVQAQPTAESLLPVIEAYDEPILPAAFTLGAQPIALYTAIGPGGLLTLNPKGALGQLAAARMPERTRVRILTDESIRPVLDLAFAERPQVELVTVDPHFIGGSHTQ